MRLFNRETAPVMGPIYVESEFAIGQKVWHLQKLPVGSMAWRDVPMDLTEDFTRERRSLNLWELEHLAGDMLISLTKNFHIRETEIKSLSMYSNGQVVYKDDRGLCCPYASRQAAEVALNEAFEPVLYMIRKVILGW